MAPVTLAPPTKRKHVEKVGCSDDESEELYPSERIKACSTSSTERRNSSPSTLSDEECTESHEDTGTPEAHAQAQSVYESIAEPESTSTSRPLPAVRPNSAPSRSKHASRVQKLEASRKSRIGYIYRINRGLQWTAPKALKRKLAAHEQSEESLRNSSRSTSPEFENRQDRKRKRNALKQHASANECGSDTESDAAPKKRRRISTSKSPSTSTGKKSEEHGNEPKKSSPKQKDFNKAVAPAGNGSNEDQKVTQSSATAASRASRRVRQAIAQQKKARENGPIAPEACDWLDMVQRVGIDGFRKHLKAIWRKENQRSGSELKKWQKLVHKAIKDSHKKNLVTGPWHSESGLPYPVNNSETSESRPTINLSAFISLSQCTPYFKLQLLKAERKRRLAEIKEASVRSGKIAPVVRKDLKDIARDPFMPDYRNLGQFKKPLHYLVWTRSHELGRMAYPMPADFKMTRTLDIKGKGYRRQPMPKPGSGKYFRFTSWEEDESDAEPTEDSLNLPQEHVSAASQAEEPHIAGSSGLNHEAE